MTTREDLHHLVDELDEAAADELLDYAHWLAADEDEPLTAEKLARVHQGEADITRGEYVTLATLRDKLSL